MPEKIKEIEKFLYFNMFEPKLKNIYTECYTAFLKFAQTEYLFTDEDRENLVMLASSWCAILRKTWRIFIVEKGYEPFRFWNAFITTITFKQNVLFREHWKKIFKDWDKDLLAMVNKTSNPNFIKRMFVGFNWNQLHQELNKYCEQTEEVR